MSCCSLKKSQIHGGCSQASKLALLAISIYFCFCKKKKWLLCLISCLEMSWSWAEDLITIESRYFSGEMTSNNQRHYSWTEPDLWFTPKKLLLLFIITESNLFLSDSKTSNAFQSVRHICDLVLLCSSSFKRLRGAQWSWSLHWVNGSQL